MNIDTIKSYGKINLTLNVIGKLNSNFHRIESLISFSKVHDLIYIKKSSKKIHTIKFSGEFSKGINKNNTIVKLLKCLDKKNLLKGKKYFFLVKKKIPQKSGMGGGSMNAAFILKYFLKKKILKIKNNDLVRIANSIGSDVVLGLDPKNSVLRSNGQVQRVNVKLKLYLLIVKPQFGCSTENIYKLINSYSRNKLKKKNNFKLYNLINGNNDLEKIVTKKYPSLLKLKIFLETLPKVKFARMTGSGSSFIAYFVEKKYAQNAAKIFRKKYKNYWSTVSKTI